MVRSFLWFIPITPPRRAFSPAIRGIIDFDICLVKNTKIANGASFCHEDKMVQEIQEMEDITEGYQKWQGALPNFNRIAIIRMVGIVDGRIEYGVHIIIDEVNKRADPKAWARKYLIDPSVSWCDLDDIRMGMNLRRFNSIEAHKNIQFVLDNAIMALIIKVDRVNAVAGDHINLIKMWRSWTPL